MKVTVRSEVDCVFCIGICEVITFFIEVASSDYSPTSRKNRFCNCIQISERIIFIVLLSSDQSKNRVDFCNYLRVQQQVIFQLFFEYLRV